MAFTKAPETSTYTTKRVQLHREINSRSHTMAKDEMYINMYFEPIRSRQLEDKRFHLTKRPGTSIVFTAGDGARRGLFYWADQMKLITAVGADIVIRDMVAETNTILTSFFGTTTGEVGFTEYLYEDNSTVILATDGVTLKQIAVDNTITEVTDVDLPTPHLPYPIFLDGYLFLVKADTAEIYNSDLNDPTSWTEGNLIVAEMEGDLIIRIAKLNNYLVAFGSFSIEYFWDAGVETGSPLQRNDTPIKINGYIGGFARFGNTLMFIGNNSYSQPDVFRLDDFKIKSMGTPIISKYLNSRTDTRTSWKGNVVSVAGRNFYILNAGFRTFVYDIETELWTRWAYQDQESFPIEYAVSVNTDTRYRCFFTMTGENQDTHRFDEDVYQDDDENFTMTVITPNEDFDTYNRKTMHRFTVICDRTSADEEMSVSWSDNDFQTFTTPRGIDLDQEMPCLYQLGQFRRRAFRLDFTANAPLRLFEIEVDINRGNT